jgi:murein DD-endopeptidase MepM/ murein hydrolase activator NlpD
MISRAWSGDWEVSQVFGANPGYYGRFGLAGHEGADLAMPAGTELLAPEPGEVVEVGLNTGAYGYYVKLRTIVSEDWLVAHLLPYDLPRPGTWLGAGARLGWSGNSGNSTGPHLHIGYRPVHWARGWPFNGWSDPIPGLGNG